jgi:hypothetical protein
MVDRFLSPRRPSLPATISAIKNPQKKHTIAFFTKITYTSHMAKSKAMQKFKAKMQRTKGVHHQTRNNPPTPAEVYAQTTIAEPVRFTKKSKLHMQHDLLEKITCDVEDATENARIGLDGGRKSKRSNYHEPTLTEIQEDVAELVTATKETVDGYQDIMRMTHARGTILDVSKRKSWENSILSVMRAVSGHWTPKLKNLPFTPPSKRALPDK